MTKSYSELECCVLSVIERHQPCTAYQVRRAFDSSQTTSWRASTGSIYPLIRKLQGAGLILRVDQPDDRRGTGLLSLTPDGRAVAMAWLADETAELAAPVADPIRTRSYLLDLLSPAARRDRITSWITATEAALVRVRAGLARQLAAGDAAESRALRGSQLQLEARLTWLRELFD